jgi:hypothetical protein
VTDAVCDSPVYPPILLFMVEAGASDPRAPTATDARLSCTGAECGAWTGELLAPSATIATSWRDQLQAEGMQNATGRGLAFLDFREPDGSPAVGVTPFVRGVTDRQLDAPRELRFLAADRETLVRSDATMTGTSGVAIIALDGVGSALIGGTRGGLSWAPVGVLFADGWLFVEVNQRTP